MKIELMLSNTYVHAGKVYNKNFAYEVSASLGKYLLSQNNERNVFYFRLAEADTQAHLAPKKSVNKGGVPIPIEDVVDDTAAEAEAEVASGGGVTQVEVEDSPKLDEDGLPVGDDDDTDEEAITV